MVLNKNTWKHIKKEIHDISQRCVYLIDFIAGAEDSIKPYLMDNEQIEFPEEIDKIVKFDKQREKE